MNSKLKSILINVVLFAVIVFLALKVIQSIKAPIDFGNEKSLREAQVVQRLKDIRDAEIQYKQAHNRYTSNFDSLIDFCANYEIPIVMMIPDPEDTTFTKTINDTLGHLVCYTVMMLVSYFWGQKVYPIPYQVGRVFLYIAFALGLYFVSTLYSECCINFKLTINTLLIVFFMVVVFFAERKNPLKI